MALERVGDVPALQARPRDSHKGSYGTVLVLAGSRGMAGAAALVGMAALRSGAGLVRVACPTEVQPTVAGFDPAIMTWPLAQDDQGRLRFEPNRDAIERLLAGVSTLAVGPGLTPAGDVPDLIAWLLDTVEIPVVLDADGLNAIAASGRVEMLKNRRYPTVATPHPGEFSRLSGVPVPAIQADRIGQVESFVTGSNQLVLVLKGAGTIVADARRLFVNSTGNPGMATGGSGDCLTGVIAALLAQRYPSFDAVRLGVYYHGLAGDLARDDLGELGLTARDILDYLPDAFCSE